MFVIMTQNDWFFTGRAGWDWTAPMVEEAFRYSRRAEAERKAAQMNRMTALHKIEFRVEEVV